MGSINRPIEFRGTEAEKEANRRTHYYPMSLDGDQRCVDCDCKPWHKAAEYPCGQEPPRETITYES